MRGQPRGGFLGHGAHLYIVFSIDKVTYLWVSADVDFFSVFFILALKKLIYHPMLITKSPNI